MPNRTVQIEESDYHYLKKVANISGLSVEKLLRQMIARHRSEESRYVSEESGVSSEKSRWAKFSDRIQKNPPLRGAGDHVREKSKEFREEFGINGDRE